ncbi:MAG TPA: hypothetical protein VFN62_03810 [Acidobacteriaceae bacterium]|nr:hypothetical protein [Acidobacteriaceae bacterium]
MRSDEDPIEDGTFQAVETDDVEFELPQAAPPFPPLDSMLNLFKWYERHFCRAEITDCRNFPVEFCEGDFVHLVKIVDRYGKEPKNRADTIRRIKAGEFKMFNGTRHSPANFSVQRAKDLACALAVIQDPWMIVPNWQPLGKANPGEAYIRNFGKDGRRRFRVLICGVTGRRRSPVTMFPRQRFAAEEILIKLWPKTKRPLKGDLF